VTLPGVSSVSAVQLDVSRSEVTVLVPGKFSLPGAPLPFPVDSDRGKAKFDKTKAVLEVVLPVLAPPPPPPPTALYQAAGSACHPLVEPIGAASTKSTTQASPMTEERVVSSKDANNNAVAGGCSPLRETEEPPMGIPLMAALEAPSVPSNDPSPDMTENQRRWAELHGAKSIDSPVDPGAPPSSTMQAVDVPSVAGAKTVVQTHPTTVTLKPRLKSNVVNELD
jgi:hypothetical protein